VIFSITQAHTITPQGSEISEWNKVYQTKFTAHQMPDYFDDKCCYKHISERVNPQWKDTQSEPGQAMGKNPSFKLKLIKGGDISPVTNPPRKTSITLIGRENQLMTLFF